MNYPEDVITKGVCVCVCVYVCVCVCVRACLPFFLLLVIGEWKKQKKTNYRLVLNKMKDFHPEALCALVLTANDNKYGVARLMLTANGKKYSMAQQMRPQCMMGMGPLKK